MINHIYYLSIPKTSSSYFKKNLFNPLSEYLLENGINTLNFGDHQGWGPIIDNTYIITILRDPVKRTISHYCHQTLTANTVEVFLSQTKNNFLSWFENNKDYLADFQSKNILYSKSENLLGSGWMTNNDPDFINMNIDSNILKERIGSINLLMKSSQINFNTLENISIKIQNDFNLSYKKVTPDIDISYSLSSFSQNIYNAMSKSEIDMIYNSNPNDTEIYFNSNYFGG